jgi:Probable sensor domain DACNG/Probable sensor domain DACNH
VHEDGSSHDDLRAFCGSYRRWLTSGVRTAFDAIGFTGGCDVLFVGLQADPTTPARVEPVDGVTAPDRSVIQERLDELRADDSQTDRLHAHVVQDPIAYAALVDRLRGRAVAEVLASQLPGKHLFTSRSVVVRDLDIYVLLAVDTDHLDLVPSLPVDACGRPRSLVHAVLDEVMTRFWRALVAPDGEDWVIPLGLPTSDLVRSAAGRLVRAALVGIGGTRMTYSADALLNAISALPYEGRAGAGTLVLAAEEVSSAEVLLHLATPVRLRERRTVRKLMEANDERTGLLVNREGSVYALGRVQPDDEQALVVSFAGRGAWDLMLGGRPILSVRDGEARLPSAPLDEAAFRSLVERLLHDADFDRLLELADATARHHHGAMIIISSDAAGEAARLSPQCIAVEPTALSADLVTRLTSMDGATLVDPRGRCHAVGVIVDGRAKGAGDMARGSRFNNPIRYLHDNTPDTVILVFSSDGGVDLLPQLQPLIDRARVQAAVQRYVDLVASSPPVRGAVFEAWDQVDDLAFYLSEADCTAVNRASTRLEAVCRETDVPFFGVREFQPDPQMNDDHWLP